MTRRHQTTNNPLKFCCGKSQCQRQNRSEVSSVTVSEVRATKAKARWESKKEVAITSLTSKCDSETYSGWWKRNCLMVPWWHWQLLVIASDQHQSKEIGTGIPVCQIVSQSFAKEESSLDAFSSAKASQFNYVAMNASACEMARKITKKNETSMNAHGSFLSSAKVVMTQGKANTNCIVVTRHCAKEV